MLLPVTPFLLAEKSSNPGKLLLQKLKIPFDNIQSQLVTSLTLNSLS
jgi:hypothetical protein